MKILPFLAFVAIVLAGCKSNPAIALKDAPIGTIQPGWTKIENAEQGMSLYAPPGWKVGAATSMDLPSMGGMGEGDSSAFLAKMQEEQDKADAEAAKELESKGVYISVINKGSKAIPGEERTRFTVKRVDEGGNVAMDEVTDMVKKYTGEAAAVTLPIGAAMRGTSSVTLKDGGVVTKVAYGIPDGKSIYMMEFITEESPEVIMGIEKQVAESFRAKKKS